MPPLNRCSALSIRFK
jgi:DNA-binding NarL/FixJ family response regulator